MIRRRRFLEALARTAGAVSLSPLAAPSVRGAEGGVPARALTHRPGYHWFGYYDKLQFSPDDRYVLGMETVFEGRTPTPDDVIGVGMVDTARQDRWIEFGRTRAWGWQQGCMLQWRPPATREVLWNDREDTPDASRFVTRVLDVETGASRRLPRPVYAVSPDGRWAVSADFARIQRLRPGYGYQGIPDPYADLRAPRDGGIDRVDLRTGACELIVSLADLAAIPFEGSDLSEATHYVNHLLVSPDGERFLFLHRWRPRSGSADEERYRPVGGFGTRMFTANPDGSDLYALDPSGYTSHFIWDDPHHVTAWTRPARRPWGFYRLRDRTREVEPVGAGIMTLNGHNTYLPGTGNEWILNDTYPRGDAREQTLYLFHEPTGRKVVLGQFHEPAAYVGEWRCDLHPRASRDGTHVCIDSTHEGHGRQMYLLDVGAIVG
jgi:hypothetical protein